MTSLRQQLLAAILGFVFGVATLATEPILVVGHKNPDTDTVVSALAVAHLKSLQGSPAQPITQGAPNAETRYVLEAFGLQAPPVLTSVAGRQVYLVDHSDYRWRQTISRRAKSSAWPTTTSWAAWPPTSRLKPGCFRSARLRRSSYACTTRRWVSNSWNSHTDKLLRDALTDYFTTGLTREQLAARFAEDFAGLGERGARYWELLADHTATKTRELGRVDGYLRAGIETIQVRAHLDARTTEICRHMHGRVIAVKRLEEQRAAYLEAVGRRDEEAAKRAWTMHKDASSIKEVATQDLPKGTAGPPYHFRCRTITVMYTEPEEEVSRWRDQAVNRAPLSRQETAALIERCTGAAWDSEPALASHAAKHARHWGGVSAYNQAAMDRIRRADRDVYLAVERGALKALFVEPYTSRRGQRKFRVTIVAVDSKRLVSQHTREALENDRYDVQPIKLPGRGIMKWLLS